MTNKTIIGYKGRMEKYFYLCPDCAVQMKRELQSFTEGEEEPCKCDNCGEIIEDGKSNDNPN